MALAGEVANLIVQLRLDDSGFTGKLNNASRTLSRMDSGLSQVGRGVGQVSGGLLRLGERAALAAAGGLTAVVTTAASFEQAFTGVEKTVDGTDVQLGKLEETLRGMARSMPVSFEELAAIGEQGGALGVARESLDEFIDVVARLAVSTDLSSEQAATALGQLGQVLDLSGKEFEDFADSLVALGNAGASTESQIVEMASRFAASGKSAGLTKEEILALSSATASMGIEVEAGGTALSQTFDKVALAIGTGSKEAKAFADILGQSAKEFRTNWERDALGTFQDFLRELSKLDQFEQAAALEQVGITGVRQQRAVRLMAQNYEFLNDQLKVAADSQGALRKESDKFFGTAQGQWKTFINVVRDGAAIIGTEVLPVTKEILEDLTGGLDNPQTRKRLQEFGKDLAQGIRTVVRELKGADFTGLIDGMKLAGQIASRAFDLFRSLPPQVQALAVTAIAANRLSGGAVGSIAKGLGNILLGGTKIGANLLGLRGQTPATPMYVAVVGPGVPGGPGGVVGAAGKAGWGGAIAASLKSALSGAFAVTLGVVIGEAIGKPIYDAAVEPAKKFYNEQLTAVAESGDPARIQRGIDALTRQIEDFEGRAPQVRQMWGPFIDKLEADRAALMALLPGGAGRSGGSPWDLTGEIDDIPRVREEIRALRNDDRNYDAAQGRRFASLEQRLIKDKNFAQELTPERFLKILARTSEFGAKGEGTAIEFGPKTGRDPFGQAFLALARRLPPEHLKDRQVIGELQRHIVAAEEVQSRLIKEGDLEGARKLQRTIDGIHKLLGTQDRTNALLREQKRLQQETSNRIRDARTAIHEQQLALGGKLDASNTKLGIIAAKNPNLNLNLTIPVASYVSVNEVVRQSVVVGTIRNNIPVGPG